jgi:LysR family transcriptional regulator for metE and metH
MNDFNISMEVRHLKLVKTVAEEGSLTRATKILYLTQSALSHQLKEIENQIETPVFLRVNKKLILTDAGKILLNTANTVLRELEISEIELRKSITGEVGNIRLCTECYTTYHWLPPILKNYSFNHPNIDISINTKNTLRPLELLLNNELDIAIVHRKMDNDSIEYNQLFDDEMVLVVSREHVLNKKKYIYAKDFENETLITHSKNHSKSLIFERLLIPEGVKPKKVVYIQITEAIIEMIKADLGVGVMTKWAMKPFVENRKVNVIPITRKGLWRKWYVASLKNKSRSIYLQSFINQLVKEAKF